MVQFLSQEVQTKTKLKTKSRSDKKGLITVETFRRPRRTPTGGVGCLPSQGFGKHNHSTLQPLHS